MGRPTGLAIVPGIGDSGPGHWQSLWQSAHDGRRLVPTSWDEPDATDWIRAVDELVRPDDLVVAHSLGCLAVATWLASGGTCRGALLVAVPDPAGPEFPHQAKGFDTTRAPLSTPTTVVASTDDPYASVPYAEHVAATWGAELVVAGAHGHLNAASGLGDWPEGRALLERLEQLEVRTDAPAPPRGRTRSAAG